MNRSQLLAAGAILALGAIGVTTGLGSRGVDIQGASGRDAGDRARPDPRPIIDDAIRMKASPSADERRWSLPGRLRDGGAVVWTISAGEPVRIAPPCLTANCWTLADGGWDDDAVVDCRRIGLGGLPDGGPRWAGCNTFLASEAVGTACVPTACSVQHQHDPREELKP